MNNNNRLIQLGKVEVAKDNSIKKSDYNKRYYENNRAQMFLELLEEILTPDKTGRYATFINASKQAQLDNYVKHIKSELNNKDCDILEWFAMHNCVLNPEQRTATLLLFDIDVCEFLDNIFKFKIENDKNELNRLKIYIHNKVNKYQDVKHAHASICDSVLGDFVKMLYKSDMRFEQLQMYQYINTLVVRHVQRQFDVDNHTLDEDTLGRANFSQATWNAWENNNFANPEQDYHIREYLKKFEQNLNAVGIESMFDFIMQLNSLDSDVEKLYMVEGAKKILDYKVMLSDSDIRIVKDYIANQCTYAN